ncbi:MAG: cupin domain-containing protein [Phycisphaerae bacterium]|nr:cupin domain-containing protein [Phycisphaerae bacterium]
MATQVETEQILRRSLNSPDESRSLGSGELQQVRLGGVVVSRITLEPGWRWSRDVKPMGKTDSCQARHVQYIVTGRLMIAMDDGTKMELSGGDAAVIPPGHDAWVLGPDEVTIIDFSGDMKAYAR